MSHVVLDASAVLALLLGEPGADRVKATLDGAALGAVNLAEVVSHYAKLGAARPDIETSYDGCRSVWCLSTPIFPSMSEC